jgi:predicted 2-oxoglutarate/Fe(II)-dependent dioxygenase YbiX
MYHILQQVLYLVILKIVFLSEHYDGCKDKIAIIYYLNNVEKDNGGVLVINNETYINPKENTLVIMKTDILHKVERILNSKRWSIIFWMN